MWYIKENLTLIYHNFITTSFCVICASTGIVALYNEYLEIEFVPINDSNDAIHSYCDPS